jgi:hypothetical protein
MKSCGCVWECGGGGGDGYGGGGRRLDPVLTELVANGQSGGRVRAAMAVGFVICGCEQQGVVDGLCAEAVSS